MPRWSLIPVFLLAGALGVAIGRLSLNATPAPQPAVNTAVAEVKLVKRGRLAFVDVPSRAPSLSVGDRIDVLGALSTDGGTLEGLTLIQDVEVAVAEHSDAGVTRLGLTLLPEEAQLLLLARTRGTVDVTRRHPDDIDVLEEMGSIGPSALLTGERVRILQQKRFNVICHPRGPEGCAPELLSKKKRAAFAEVPRSSPVSAGSKVDLLAVLPDPKTGDWVSVILLQAVSVVGAMPGPNGTTRLTLEVIPEEAEVLLLARTLGRVEAVVREPDDVDVLEQDAHHALSAGSLADREWRNALNKRRQHSELAHLRLLPDGGLSAPETPAASAPR